MGSVPNSNMFVCRLVVCLSGRVLQRVSPNHGLDPG